VSSAPTPFETRAATLADVPVIVALVNSAYRGDSSRAGWTTEADLVGGQRVDEQGVAAIIARDGNVVLLHEEDGQAVACVHLQRTGSSCYVGMMTVEPTRQGRRLGRQMLDAAERRAMSQWQSTSMHMTVLVQRTDLMPWYERRGYRRTGELKPFPYDDPRFGLALRNDLRFEVLRKTLMPDP
jgi:ribosomal protein S18 acetylase RimI-like enzyme